MPTAGPVEFSTGDLVILVAAVALSFLAVPLIVGAIAAILYTRRTPPEQREKRGRLKMFMLWTSLAFLVQIAVLALWGWITGSS
ncbi:MAG: hypothetical protein QOG54_1279 [Actinomycetota bacterium]|nr:hypothetical protein [Actinomycetota bacterium]